MDGLFTKDAALYLGRVISNDDNVGGNRIKATIYPADKRKTAREIPYAFPLIPKMVHIVPKVGEMVIIICDDMNNPNSQRYYLGPIISQPQFLFHEGSISATSLLKGGVMPELPSPASYASMHGAFPKVDEIAILGRKNSDIILSDNDLRIRCGVRLVDENNNKNIIFNKESPSYIKLKHYPVRLQEGAESTATIVADKINLISNVGEPYFNVADTNEGISDEEMREIIEKAHRLPYGDVLVNFLSLLLKMFKSHTHKYHNLPPCPDTNSSIFDAKYSSDENNLQQQLLSDNVRIN